MIKLRFWTFISIHPYKTNLFIQFQLTFLFLSFFFAIRIKDANCEADDETTDAEDFALAESIACNSFDNTAANLGNNTTKLSQSVTAPTATIPKQNEVTTLLPDISFGPSGDSQKKQNQQEHVASESWNETNASLKNYDYYEESVATNITMLDTSSSDLYKTVNDSISKNECQDDFQNSKVFAFGSNVSKMQEPSKSEDIVRFKDCLISFMHSSEDMFVQMKDFDEQIAKIQPDIDDCLDAYILSESKLCVAQYKVVNE
jgi:hypothetical protein